MYSWQTAQTDKFASMTHAWAQTLRVLQLSLLSLFGLVQELDLSGTVFEACHVACLQHLTRLTALYLAQVRVLSAPPTIAGVVLAHALAPLTCLQRLTLGGFAASTDAALAGAGAACARTLTWLDLNAYGAMNKSGAAAPDFGALANLTALRELRIMHVDWREQGVSGATANATFQALPALRRLALTLPEGAMKHAWGAKALAGVNEELYVLVLGGDLGGEPALSSTDTKSASVNGTRSATQRAQRAALRTAFEQLGVMRFRKLHALACQCEEAPPELCTEFEAALAAEVGLPQDALLLHVLRGLKDILPRGGMCCSEDHPHDMRLVYSKYVGD